MPSIRVRQDDYFDVVLRRFRRSCDRAGVFTESRRKEFYEKPTSINKREKAVSERRESKRASRGRIRRRHSC
ncbi:MAG: small subunit ribosomal protein S21 [Saprospiraceae bacterium]|jgi:small subunit ribosomal protein S21